MRYYYFADRRASQLLNFRGKLFEFLIPGVNDELADDGAEIVRHTHKQLEKHGRKLAQRLGQCVFVVSSSQPLHHGFEDDDYIGLEGVWSFSADKKPLLEPLWIGLDATMQIDGMLDYAHNFHDRMELPPASSETERAFALLERIATGIERVAGALEEIKPSFASGNKSETNG